MAILLCTIVSAASCQNTTTTGNDKEINQNVNEGEQKEEGLEETAKAEENENKADTVKDDRVETKLDLQETSLEYQLETDFQPFFIGSKATKSENGYYFWGGKYTDMIMFCDNTSGMTVPLCNLPDCKHGEDGEYEKCNAYFGEINTNTDQNHYGCEYMQYYNGNLYLVGYDLDGYVNIYKIAPDGSTREKSCTLYKADFTDPLDPENPDVSRWRQPYICIHRGYVYFINNDESELKLRRVKIDSKEEPQVIYEAEGVRPNLYRMEGYGEYIFFQAGNFTDESYEEIEAGIYAYQIEKGEISLVKNDAINSYIIRNGVIYYSTDTGIRCYDLSTQKDEEFVETEAYADVMADENYIYINTQNDEDKVIVYDENQKKIAEIELEDCLAYIYGDEKYLFASWSNGADSSGVKRLDKSLLKDGTVQWESLP